MPAEQEQAGQGTSCEEEMTCEMMLWLSWCGSPLGLFSAQVARVSDVALLTLNKAMLAPNLTVRTKNI
jgi:hypothetical protein